MNFFNDFAISDSENDSNYSKVVSKINLDNNDIDDLVYSDSEDEICVLTKNLINYTYTTPNKRIKRYDFLESIKENIIKMKPLNKHQIYYINNMASKNDIKIINALKISTHNYKL
jgi:hypothetical protein